MTAWLMIQNQPGGYDKNDDIYRNHYFAISTNGNKVKKPVYIIIPNWRIVEYRVYNQSLREF